MDSFNPWIAYRKNGIKTDKTDKIHKSRVRLKKRPDININNSIKSRYSESNRNNNENNDEKSNFNNNSLSNNYKSPIPTISKNSFTSKKHPYKNSFKSSIQQIFKFIFLLQQVYTKKCVSVKIFQVQDFGVEDFYIIFLGTRALDLLF